MITEKRAMLKKTLSTLVLSSALLSAKTYSTELNDLPHEIHESIFVSLNKTTDFYALGSTCKYWKSLANEKIHGAVIVIGPTGSGKSTLVHLLAGKQLMSKPKKGVFGGYKLELAQGENLPNINISHGVACGTLTPVSILDFLHKRILIDCPPFSDSMSEQNDFNHAVDIHKVLKGRIRVILTLDEYIFDDQRGQRFTFMLNKLTEIFPDQDQLKKVLYLVVNKEKLMSVNKNLKSHILDGRPSYLTKRGYDLLQFLISNPEHIADFKAPIEEGPYNVSESLQQVLNSTHYVNNPKICPPVEKSVMSSYQNRWSSLHPYDEKGEQSNY